MKRTKNLVGELKRNSACIRGNKEDRNEDYKLSSYKPKRPNNQSTISRTYYVSLDQRHIVDEIKNADSDNLSITKDCGITNVLFSRIQVENHLKRGLVYLSIYKALKKLGYSNAEINTSLEENIFVIEDINFPVNVDIDAIIKLLGKEKIDINKALTTIYRYSKTKQTLFHIKLDKDVEFEVIKNRLEKNEEKSLDSEEAEQYNAVEKNIKTLNTLAKAENVDNQTFASSIIKNFDRLQITDKQNIIDYLSILNLAGLDYTVLNGNINVLLDFVEQEIYLPILYRYVREGIAQKSGVVTLETLQIIMDNFDYDTLKSKYPVFINNKPVFKSIRNDYIKRINEKIENMKNANLGESRK